MSRAPPHGTGICRKVESDKGRENRWGPDTPLHANCIGNGAQVVDIPCLHLRNHIADDTRCHIKPQQGIFGIDSSIVDESLRSMYVIP